jgi:fumarate hydratase subunit beta
MKKIITLPFHKDLASGLDAGDEVLINGVIYTARDAAHKRLIALINENKPLPVNLRDQILYYTGPSPARPGQVIGSAGPTTAGRMDKYTPQLIATSGLRGIIGKGNRNPSVIESLIKNRAVYFAAIGGAGALLSKCIVTSEIVCYEDLGPEAIFKLKVKDFPAIVAIDSSGKNLYER